MKDDNPMIERRKLSSNHVLWIVSFILAIGAFYGTYYMGQKSEKRINENTKGIGDKLVKKIDEIKGPDKRSVIDRGSNKTLPNSLQENESKMSLEKQFVKIWNEHLTSFANNLASTKVSIISYVRNNSEKEMNWMKATTATVGNDVHQMMYISNPTNHKLTNVHVRTQLPSGLKYEEGYAKLYYKDDTGNDRHVVISEEIYPVHYNGAMLLDIPENHYVMVTYKTRVNKNAIQGGIYSVSNQMSADNEIAVADNNGLVIIKTRNKNKQNQK